VYVLHRFVSAVESEEGRGEERTFRQIARCTRELRGRGRSNGVDFEGLGVQF
jgi:hypothetical protein